MRHVLARNSSKIEKNINSSVLDYFSFCSYFLYYRSDGVFFNGQLSRLKFISNYSGLWRDSIRPLINITRHVNHLPKA